MLAGVLTVLKIIGIVLLWILAIILAILLLVLFVPIRYRIDGLIPETEFDQGFDVEKIKGSAKITWLFHFVSAVIAYPENKEFTLRILGIKILPKSEKKDKEKKKDKKEKSGKKKKDKKDKEDKVDVLESSVNEEIAEDNSEGVSENIDENNSSDKENSSESDNSNIGSDEKDKAFIEVFYDFLDKVEKVLKTPQDVLQNIQYTISRVCGKIGMIKTTLENDIFKRAFELVKRKLLRLLKMILPDKTKVDLEIGLGDPADTAELMALYGALYPWIFKGVSFEPDFDRKVIYADAHFKGHITVFTVLYCLCVCYFNKDVKKVIRRFKKILNS